MFWSINNTIFNIIILLNIGQIITSSLVVSQKKEANVEVLFQKAMKSLKKEKKEVKKAVNDLQSDKRKFEKELQDVQRLVNATDLIRLNVGGQIIVTRRATLTKIPNSKLAKVFDSLSSGRLFPDRDGTYFLDYNPILFSHLLDQLRTLKNNETIVFRPPSSSLSIKPFYQMLQDLGLSTPRSSENDIIVLNVGGEKIVTLRKTLAGVADANIAILALNSTEFKRDRYGRIFLDYNPTIFRHLLDQSRERNRNIYQSTLAALSFQTTVSPTSTIKTIKKKISTTKKSKNLPIPPTKKYATKKLSRVQVSEQGHTTQNLNTKMETATIEKQIQNLGTEIETLTAEEQIEHLGTKMETSTVEAQPLNSDAEIETPTVEEQLQNSNTEVETSTIEETTQNLGTELETSTVEETTQNLGTELETSTVEETTQNSGTELETSTVEEKTQSSSAEMKTSTVEEITQNSGTEMEPSTVEETTQSSGTELETSTVEETTQNSDTKMETSTVEETTPNSHTEMETSTTAAILGETVTQNIDKDMNTDDTSDYE